MTVMKKFAVFTAILVLVVSAGLAQKKGAAKDEKKGAAGDAAAGGKIFKEKCTICHYADKADKRIGPGMKGVFKREKMWDDKPMNEANVREMILKGGGKMVGFEDQLDKKEIDNVVAYLKTL